MSPTAVLSLRYPTRRRVLTFWPCARRQTQDSPQDIPEEDGSSALADSSVVNPDETHLITQVAAKLATPKNATIQASRDYSNSIHEGNNEGVQAYAKIAGQDWTFYVTKTIINIGRTSEPRPQYPDGYDPDEDDEFVHVDLGPSKMISRQHAQISFNPNSKDGSWFLRVLGRNGVKVNGVPWKQHQVKPLESGEVIEIGGVEMIFVLPLESSALHIDDVYLKRAGISGADFTSPLQDSRSLRPVSAGHSTPTGSRNALPKGQPFQQPIAPAPPDWKRPGTPPSARGRAAASQNKSPQFRDGSTMMMNASDVDLSLTDNKHIKPQFSYAQMITQAITSTDEERLNLSGIYGYITEHYSYYRHQSASGWQVSLIRLDFWLGFDSGRSLRPRIRFGIICL